MKNLLFILLLTLTYSCSDSIKDIAGVYEPVTVITPMENEVLTGHKLELYENGEMALVVKDKARFIGTFYVSNLNFIWEYNNSKVPFKYNSSDNTIKFITDNKLSFVYKKVGLLVKSGKKEKEGTLPIKERKKNSNWLN